MRYIAAVLKSAPILVITSYFIIVFATLAPYFVSRYVVDISDKSSLSTLISLVAYTWVILLFIPLTLNKFIFKERLEDFGLIIPKRKIETLFLVLIALAILLPCIFYFAKRNEFQLGYDMSSARLDKFILIQITILPLYYFAEEFFFRGFLLYSLWRKVRWHAFWITGIFFAYAHVGKPLLEIGLAVPASVILNLITLRTRSIYPAMSIHLIMGITLNVLVRLHIP